MLHMITLTPSYPWTRHYINSFLKRGMIQQGLCIELQFLKSEDRPSNGVLSVHHKGQNITRLLFLVNMSVNQLLSILLSAFPLGRKTSNTFVRPSLTNRGSGISLRTGIIHGIPSNYHHPHPSERNVPEKQA